MELFKNQINQNQFYHKKQLEPEDDVLYTIRKKLLPPNQIITKNYQADIKPEVKLLSLKKDKNIKNYEEASEQLSTIDQNLWNTNFQESDALGYHYSQKLKNSIVYHKYDNKKYMECSQNRCKYIGGFFIPLADLLKPQIKKQKNLYTSLNYTIQSFNYTKDGQNLFNANNEQLVTLNCPEIKFSSNYQSSNLFLAIKTGQFQYDLILQNDINSKGTTQWFNFAVSLGRPEIYKFNIVNLTKSHSLFQKGMKIPLFSYSNHALNGANWQRGCFNISYQKNSINRQGRHNQSSYYYTLHFQYENKQKSDIVIFSYGYPYNGLDMERFFNKITHKKLSINLKIDKIKVTQTLTGLPIWVYHIYPKYNASSLNNLNRTQFSLLQNKFIKNRLSNPLSNHQGIVFLSRQHPGESQSSFILQGILEFILENNEYDQNKKNYHFYLFPSVNADGIFYGNYRTNLSGNDLNRIWRQPRKDFHSEVYFIKKYLFNVNRFTPLKLIIDLHGHSSALNSFFYGNPKKQNIFQAQNPKLFPYYCSKQMKQISFSHCTFHISQDKKNSARVVLNQMFPKALVYTLQNSFMGYKKGKRIIQFTIERYKKLGRQLMGSYFQYAKITERVPQIKQKWQKQIQILYNSKSKITQSEGKISQEDANDDSDSQISKQLIQFDQQFQKIDKNLQNEQKVNKQDLLQNRLQKKSNQSQMIFNFSNSRLYENKRYHPSLGFQTSKQKQAEKSFPGIILKQDTSSQFNFALNPGFLSIVKIQTKKNSNQKLNQNQQSNDRSIERTDNKGLNGNNKNFKTYSSAFYQKQNQQKQNLSYKALNQTNSQLSPQNNGQISPLQTPKRQQNVRQLKNRSTKNQVRQKQIRYINQKQYLLKRQRSRKLTYCVSDILQQKNSNSGLNIKTNKLSIMNKNKKMDNSSIDSNFFSSNENNYNSLSINNNYKLIGMNKDNRMDLNKKNQKKNYY